jgi:hypothetical protein
MRTRARAFSVEIKQRKRTTHSHSATSLARPGAWPYLLPLGNAAKPSADEELAQGPRQGAVREADRVFQPPWKGVQPVEMQDKPIEPVTLIERPIRPLRVLPDLTAAAREQQHAAFQAPARKRAPKGLLTRNTVTWVLTPSQRSSGPCRVVGKESASGDRYRAKYSR